mgnify:CR=1 FL=1
MEMEQNVGTLDRLSRLVIALIILVFLVRSGKVNMLTAMLLLMSGAFLSSAASGSCALYTHLGITTNE